MNELTTKTDIEIMVLLADMEQAKIQLNQQLQAVQNEWMRRVQEEKKKVKPVNTEQFIPEEKYMEPVKCKELKKILNEKID